MARSIITIVERSGRRRLMFGRTFALSSKAERFPLLDTCDNSSSREYSSVGEESSSRTVLLGKLDNCLKGHKVDDAWETYKDFKRLHGFPDQLLVARLITALSYSSHSKYLRKACDLVVTLSKEKPVLLRPELVTKLALSLARAQMQVPASTVLRLLLEKKSLPKVDVLGMIFLHLTKTETGAYLASNVLVDICDFFVKAKEKKAELTMVFTIVLDACVRFGSSLKGQQIIELMPQVGVVADARTIVTIARVHEMNGMRAELKKFKRYIDNVPVTFGYHYREFYDCLLSLHLKFADIDAASTLVLDICSYFEVKREPQQKPCTVLIGSENIRTGLRLQLLPCLLQKDSLYKVDDKQEFVMYKNGRFLLSNKALAMLIVGYRKQRRINELSKLLIIIQNKSTSPSLCSDVIEACVCLGWLETAHDILDDLEMERSYVTESAYASLLTAYYDKKLFGEAEVLLKQITRAGLSLKEISSTNESVLAESISRNMREEAKRDPSTVHEFNSSIYFFSKAKMIGDAITTYRKMQQLKIQPTSSTFFHFVCGYSSLGMYREITILWGDIKRSMENKNSVYCRDLYELLLLSFIRGGYFERVMEVAGYMMEKGMFLDKWRYKTEFLKFHRDLYRSLTVSDAKNESQSKRIEYVRAFRKWVGIG